jgi:hypothetical protein
LPSGTVEVQFDGGGQVHLLNTADYRKASWWAWFRERVGF